MGRMPPERCPLHRACMGWNIWTPPANSCSVPQVQIKVTTPNLGSSASNEYTIEFGCYKKARLSSGRGRKKLMYPHIVFDLLLLVIMGCHDSEIPEPTMSFWVTVPILVRAGCRMPPGADPKDHPYISKGKTPPASSCNVPAGMVLPLET